MARKSISIIGAGYSGLSAGIYAQRAGFDTKIFEYNHAAGGLAASYRKGDYLFDNGTHFLMGYRNGERGIYDTLTDLGVTNKNLFKPMTNFATFIDEKTGIKMDMGLDIEKFGAEMLKNAPADKEFIEVFVKAVRAFGRNYPLGLPYERPHEMEGMVSRAMFVFKLRKVIKYMGKTYGQPVKEFAKRIKTPWLQAMINSMFIAEIPMWFLFMIMGVFSNNQIAYIKNGCGSLVSTLENNYKSLGGDISFNSEVTKVLANNGKACGIKLKNGEEFKSDYVIAAGNGETLLYKLLEGKYLTPALENRYKTHRTCRPFFFANYGVKKEFNDSPSYTNLVFRKPIKCGPNEIDRMNVRILNYGNFAPKGKTFLQGLYEAEPGYWENLRKHDISAYESEKKRIADELLDRMEEHYPGIKANIEVSDIATPYTTVKYTLNKHGSWGGWEVTDDILKNKLNQTLPGLKNFYMAGHWAAFGGVVPSMSSGKAAIKLITSGF